MDSTIKWFFIVTGGVILAGITYFLIKRDYGKVGNAYSPEIKDEGISEKIINFLNQYKEDWKKYRYVNFYSKQFDIKSDNNNYTMKVKRMATINELGIEDKKIALIELAKIIETEIGIKLNNSNSNEFLFFLQNYFELKVEKEILEEIISNINNNDIERYNNYKNNIETRITELIVKAKNDYM